MIGEGPGTVLCFQDSGDRDNGSNQIVLVLGACLRASGAAVCLAGIGEYRLALGDVVEISVIGAPDLRRRATVDPDGRFSLPLLGRMNAAG